MLRYYATHMKVGASERELPAYELGGFGFGGGHVRTLCWPRPQLLFYEGLISIGTEAWEHFCVRCAGADAFFVQHDIKTWHHACSRKDYGWLGLGLGVRVRVRARVSGELPLALDSWLRMRHGRHIAADALDELPGRRSFGRTFLFTHQRDMRWVQLVAAGISQLISQKTSRREQHSLKLCYRVLSEDLMRVSRGEAGARPRRGTPLRSTGSAADLISSHSVTRLH